MLYPLLFRPIFKPRVWGSETWAISDRPGDESVVDNGPLTGQSIHRLMKDQREALIGDADAAVSGRFPLLCKLIEARETLSVQVHPPATRAAELGGEAKTELWYIDEATPGAELHVGLKRGITRREFEERIADGTVAECLHRVRVSAGDAMFLPSGRVHAIGGGIRLFEIQQNSDTTYRVFDWNRMGLDGKPRELHTRESLASIDFTDVEPGPITAVPRDDRGFRLRPLVRDPLFEVDEYCAQNSDALGVEGGHMRVIAAVKGALRVSGGHAGAVDVEEGAFCLLPASVSDGSVAPTPGSVFLVARV